MGDPVTMALIGAGIGGGTSLLKGKSLGKSLKSAAIGGALGGAGGLAGQGLMGATGGATSLVPEANLLPSVSNTGSIIANGGSALDSLGASSLAETGLSNSLIPTMNLANSTAAAPSFLSQFGQAAKDYATPQNLLGVGQLLSQPNPQPTFASGGSGKIEVGEAPTGAIYDELRKLGYTMPKRRETNFSLLG